jgi:hypothetical protein
MNQDAPSYSMSMFRDWEAAVPFLGRLTLHSVRISMHRHGSRERSIDQAKDLEICGQPTGRKLTDREGGMPSTIRRNFAGTSV